MKKILYIIICMPLLFLSACDVHELPEPPEYVKLHLRLRYETDMTIWKHLYDGTTVVQESVGEKYDNHQNQGKIRYIVRTYPVSEEQPSVQNYTQEFVFTKDISEGYDHGVTLDILPGNYNVMVWSDLLKTSSDTYFYDATDFSRIALQGDYKGDTDYRDAFRGVKEVSLVANIVDQISDTLDVAMQRPLAKFEFITNDMIEFIDKETTRVKSDAGGVNSVSKSLTPTKSINIADYKVVFYYVGFLPNRYSLFADKPVDSSTGVLFEATLKKLDNDEGCSMGCDYVFIRDRATSVTVQFVIYNKDGEPIVNSKPINIPINRNHHTKIVGSFLTGDYANGTLINPDYEGDLNLVFPR